MDNIMRFIEAARRRLQRFRIIAYALYGLISGSAVLLLLLVIGRFVPIAWLSMASVAIPIAGGLGGLLWGWLNRVPIEEAALAMDQVPDGSERSDMMVTALSFKEEQSQAAKWQREQAERYGARFAEQLPERLPSPSRKRQLWICGAVLVAVIVLVFVPNPMDKKVEAAKEQQSWMKEQVAKTEKLAEQLQKETLDPADRKKLQEKLDALKKALEHEKQPEQALDKLEEAMKELEKLAKQQEEKAKALSELAKKMQQEKALDQVGKRLAEGMAEELKQEMKKLTEQVKKMSQEEKNELSDALKKLAEEASKQMENGDLEKELKKAADSLKDGKLPKELEEALQQLAEELAKAAQAKAASDSQSQSAASLAASLASQGLSLADQMAAAGMSVSDAWSNGGSAEAMVQAGLGEGSGEQGEGSEGSSSEGESGSGQGAGSGQGSGSGSGPGTGSGSGSGSGGSGGSGTGSGAGLGTGGRELVTIPRDYKGSGNVQSDSGATKGGGGDIQKGGVSPTVPGMSRPYEEVYRDYETEARKTLDRNQLPDQMQGLVEEYFIQINPNP